MITNIARMLKKKTIINVSQTTKSKINKSHTKINL